MIPKMMFFTKGVGIHKEQLESFELALRDAGIQKCNIVSVSSIFPPHCKVIPKDKGLQLLSPGEITFCVLARNSTNEPNRLVAASIGMALPSNKDTYGYLSEHHTFGETDEKAGEYAEDMAATMLATTMGLTLDPNIAWDERKQQYKASGLIIKTSNITQSAEGHKDGLWTTVLAAAVFISEENISSEDILSNNKK
jgi:arginine decarboxylase